MSKTIHKNNHRTLNTQDGDPTYTILCHLKHKLIYATMICQSFFHKKWHPLNSISCLLSAADDEQVQLAVHYCVAVAVNKCKL